MVFSGSSKEVCNLNRKKIIDLCWKLCNLWGHIAVTCASTLCCLYYRNLEPIIEHWRFFSASFLCYNSNTQCSMHFRLLRVCAMWEFSFAQLFALFRLKTSSLSYLTKKLSCFAGKKRENSQAHHSVELLKRVIDNTKVSFSKIFSQEEYFVLENNNNWDFVHF